MKTKKILNDEIARLNYRIEELEEKICPCKQHTWINIDYFSCGGTGNGDETMIYKYMCQKCGKKIQTWKVLDQE